MNGLQNLLRSSTPSMMRMNAMQSPARRQVISLSTRKISPYQLSRQAFQRRRPLNVPPLPQGRPVQFQAGQSDAGITVGARYAEVVYTSQPKLEDAVAFATELRRRATQFGRGNNLPFIMNSLHSLIGSSEADVARRLKDKHERQSTMIRDGSSLLICSAGI